MGQWSNFEKLSATHQIPPSNLERQIIKLAKTTKLVEAKDLQYLLLRNTCITNAKLHKMGILQSPGCTLCTHPSQNSTHRFYHCPHIKPVWDCLSDITKDTPIQHQFSFSCSIINVQDVPKNHPLILLTNYTRLIIDRAHINSLKIHPNTFLHKILNLAEIFSANYKHETAWANIAHNCKKMLKPFNPQIFVGN